MRGLADATLQACRLTQAIPGDASRADAVPLFGGSIDGKEISAGRVHLRCSICGAAYTVQVGVYLKQGSKYCSPKCYHLAKRTKVPNAPRNCMKCGSVLDKPRIRLCASCRSQPARRPRERSCCDCGASIIGTASKQVCRICRNRRKRKADIIQWPAIRAAKGTQTSVARGHRRGRRQSLAGHGSGSLAMPALRGSDTETATRIV